MRVSMEPAMPWDWLWGDLPEGFKRVRVNRTRVIVAREGAEAFLSLEKLLADESAQREGSRFHGRERLAVLRMDNEGSALARSYRHGGMLRRLTGGFFFTWPARPFKELAVTEEARRRGLPTVEILAACVERICGPFYRGWLVTRELEGARDLWAAVQEEGLATISKKSLLETVARTVRLMHRHGIYHRDLNLKNILVRREADRLASYI